MSHAAHAAGRSWSMSSRCCRESATQYGRLPCRIGSRPACRLPSPPPARIGAVVGSPASCAESSPGGTPSWLPAFPTHRHPSACGGTREPRHTRARSPRRRPQGRALEALGPLPLRAPVGHGAGGLFRRWFLLELPAARSRAEPCLSLGRGRPLRCFGRSVPPEPRAGALERERPHPQGTPL